MRQLVYYGFTRTPTNTNTVLYSHPCFQRDLPHLVHQIRRKTESQATYLARQRVPGERTAPPSMPRWTGTEVMDPPPDCVWALESEELERLSLSVWHPEVALSLPPPTEVIFF